jgi:hypothetical protein
MTYSDIPIGVEDPDAYVAEHERLEQLLANVRDGAWLDEQEFPPLGYAIPGVIPEGFTILSGAPKVGKSWAILDLCLAVASGGRALGHLQVDRSPVMYLALEDGHRRLQDRIRQILPGEPIPTDFHYLTTAQPSRIIDTIRGWMTRRPDTRLIVLDTLGRVMPQAQAGETTYQRDYRVGTALKAVADDHPGLAVVVVHHTRKAYAADFVEAASGTFGIAGSADTVITLTRARHEDLAVIAVTGRDVQEAEYGIERHESGGWHLAGGTLDSARSAASQYRAADTMDRQGDRMKEIVTFVNARKLTSPKDLADHLSMTPQDAASYLARAVARGLIDKAGHGKYLPLTDPVVPVVVPYSQEGNEPEPTPEVGTTTHTTAPPALRIASLSTLDERTAP